jgi:hypothetical protein
MHTMNKPTFFQELPDFSLVLGGPLFQLFRKSHLSGSALELLHRRLLAFWIVTWLPLLFLSVLGGHALGGAIKIPFLHDLEVQVRFLAGLPVLIVAELIVHLRIRPVVSQFVEGRLVIPEDLPKFHAAINSAMRLRNSISLEVGLLILVWTAGHWLWRSQIAIGENSWYALLENNHWHLTPAGYWYAFVSIPIFQFILVRWYLRFFIWFRFLWQVSRLNLRLISTHPDRAGGLAFLGKSSYAFSPVLFAQGALLAGLIASRILYEGESLVSFKMEAAGLVGFFVLFILGPLVMFTPQLARAKRRGLVEYGLLANRYVQGFEDKWVGEEAAEGDALLGSGDIQSLADLGNSYAVVREMRPVPFGLQDILRLAAATAAPLLPLLLTLFTLQDLILRLVKIVL